MNEDGSKLAIYVLDCEGVSEEEQFEFSKVYALLMLLSSTTVFNSVGLIQDSAILSMNFLLNLTKHIQLKSSFETERTPNEEISNILPNFTWILRDCFKLLDENGELVSPKVITWFYF